MHEHYIRLCAVGKLENPGNTSLSRHIAASAPKGTHSHTTDRQLSFNHAPSVKRSRSMLYTVASPRQNSRTSAILGKTYARPGPSWRYWLLPAGGRHAGIPQTGNAALQVRNRPICCITARLRAGCVRVRTLPSPFHAQPAPTGSCIINGLQIYKHDLEVHDISTQLRDAVTSSPYNVRHM